HENFQPHPTPAAPDLTRTGLRVTQRWLRDYLKQPHAIRPFGFRPGDGSRMPDFRLTDSEADEISAYLASFKEGVAPTGFRPKQLSAYSVLKARLLLTEKLSCLGCHRLGSQGGRIGPDLTMSAARLQPTYVYSVIADPHGTIPHSVMPKI